MLAARACIGERTSLSRAVSVCLVVRLLAMRRPRTGISSAIVRTACVRRRARVIPAWVRLHCGGVKLWNSA